VIAGEDYLTMTSKAAGLPDQPNIPDADLARLIYRVTLSKAVELARGGHYSEAHSLLNDLTPVEQSRPEVLDLLARIHAQKGRLREAEGCWRKALEVDPANTAYLAGLKRIAKTKIQPVWLDSLWRMTIPILGILILAVGFYALINRVERMESALEDLSRKSDNLETAIQSQHDLLTLDRETEAQDLASLNQELDRINEEIISQNSTLEAHILTSSEQLDELEHMQDAILTQLSPPDAPTVHIDLPGVVSEVYGSSLILTFEDGLFQTEAILLPEAREILTELGQQLEPYVGEISIIVVGYTDDLEQNESPDYLILSMYRAVEVVDHIVTTTQLPGSIFMLQLLEDRPAPYPNDSDANRARNRTVVLIITNPRE